MQEAGEAFDGEGVAQVDEKARRTDVHQVRVGIRTVDAAGVQGVTKRSDEPEDGREANGNGYEHRQRVADGDKADEGSAEAGEQCGGGGTIDRRVVARAVGRVVEMRAEVVQAGDVEPDGIRTRERYCPCSSEGGDHGDGRDDRTGDHGECECRDGERNRDERGDAFGFRHRIGAENGGGRSDAEAAHEPLKQTLAPNGDEECHERERDQAEAVRDFHEFPP